MGSHHVPERPVPSCGTGQGPFVQPSVSSSGPFPGAWAHPELPALKVCLSITLEHLHTFDLEWQPEVLLQVICSHTSSCSNVSAHCSIPSGFNRKKRTKPNHKAPLTHADNNLSNTYAQPKSYRFRLPQAVFYHESNLFPDCSGVCLCLVLKFM